MNDMMNKLKGIIATGSTGEEFNTATAAVSSSSSPPVGAASGASPSGSISTLNKFAPTNSGNSTPSSANAPTLIASSLNAFKINVLPRTTSTSNSAVKSEVTSKSPAKRAISNSGLGNKNFAPTGSKADRILGRCNSDSNQQKNRQNRAAAANKIVATVNSSSTPASPLLSSVGSSSITSGFCSPKQAAALIDNQSPHSPIKTQSPIRVKMPALNLEEYRIKLAAHRERDSQRCVGIGCRIKLNKNKDNNGDNSVTSSTNQDKLRDGDLSTNDGDTTENQLNNVDNSNTDGNGNINSAQDKCQENINSNETEAKLEDGNGKQESVEDTSDVNLNDKTTRSPSLKSVDSVEIVTNNTNDVYNDDDDDIDRIIESNNNVEPCSNLEPNPSTSLSVSFGTCDYKKSSPTSSTRSPKTNFSANEPAKSVTTDSLTLSIVADSGQTSTETQLTISSPPNTALEISIQSPTALGPTSIVFTPNQIKSPQPTSENHQPNNANNSNSHCNNEKPNWSKPASLRPFCFVRSLSSGVASVSPGGSIAFDTPSPRSPITQANYLCPKASTKLSTKTADDQIDPIKSLDSSSQSNSIPPLLTISDILLEIRVKSIERILISLMGKITTLVNSRDRPMHNDKQLRAIVRIGQSVNFAVERFAAVGEAIADDNPEIRNEMYDACKDARAAGSLIEQLCSITAPSLRQSVQNQSNNGVGGGGVGSNCVNSDCIYPDGSSSAAVTGVEGSIRSYADRTAMSRAARALLSSVTRVLLVADTVVVKQIVASKDRVSMTLNRLENVANFTEFVKAFSHFGMEMIELANLTTDRQNDLKNEKRRAQMSAARRTLERSTMMLLTTSKACLRHPDCQSARENRDTVFAQMRRAMDLIHFVVKEGIISSAKAALIPQAGGAPGQQPAPSSPSPHHFRPTSASSSSSSLHLPFDPHNDALLYGSDYSQRLSSGRDRSQEAYYVPKYQRRGQLHRAQRSVPGGSFVLAVESTLRWLHEQLDTCPTIVNFLRRIQELLDLARMGSLTGPVKEQVAFSLDAAIERMQDYTDSAYTSHEHRERILMLCDQTKAELGSFYRTAACINDSRSGPLPTEELEASIVQMSKLTNELRCELQDTALDQADELFRLHSSLDLPMLLKNSALDCDHEQVDELIEQFREHADHVQEVCRLLFHIGPTVSLQVTTGHTETSIEIHGEQMLTALNALVLYPTSKIAKENFEVFADVWSSLVGDLGQIMRDISDYLGPIRAREELKRPPPPPHLLQSPPQMPPQGPMVMMGPPMNASAPIQTGRNLASGLLIPGAEHGPMIGDTAMVEHGYGPGVAMPPQAGAAMPGPPPLSLPPGPEMGPAAAVGGLPPPGAVPPDGAANSNPRPTSVSINPEVDVVEIAPSDNMDDNDIVRKAKSMSAMAMSMFQFTRGEGELKTTQDLFTQAEFFADEANKLYKIVRHFTYQIPAGIAKKELLDCIDQVPNYVQQLQFAVKNVTVGKTATFTKVDNVIQETKNLMSVITRVVAACLNCANKHNLDMQGALRTRSRTLSPSHRADTEMFFEGGAMAKGGVASSDSDL